MAKWYLVTGGSGFIGAALVRRLVAQGERVRVLDNLSRGNQRRLGDVVDDVEFIEADIRDAAAVSRAAKGIDCVMHAAFVNGTQFFYTMPQLVLDVGIRGMLNVLDACLAHDVPELFVASSSEVYQTPPRIPTDETVPLSIPDPMNPRYSYAAGKITSEMLAINYARAHFERMVIFRPHNVYGPVNENDGRGRRLRSLKVRVQMQHNSGRPGKFEITTDLEISGEELASIGRREERGNSANCGDQEHASVSHHEIPPTNSDTKPACRV